MAIGSLTSRGFNSSLTYTGTTPTTPFKTTTQANEVISLSSATSTNSWLFTANLADLYIIPLTDLQVKNGIPSNFNGYSVLHVKAETSKAITGLNLKAIVVLGNSGQSYLYEALSF